MPPVTIVHYPQPTRQCIQGKFLQLLLDGEEYLLFAQSSAHRYHNQILALFLSDRGAAHRWISKQELELLDGRCSVIGGGRFLADTRRASLELWDDSQVYGRFAEEGLAAKIAAAGDIWSGFRVRIS